ncbi:hypothetical protein ACGF12_20825, partial [Kitasatospora sp. NPDC048296]
MPTQSVTMTKAPEAAPAPRPEGGGSDFARLSRRIAAEGLLDRRPGYYAVRVGLVLAAFLGGWWALLALGDTWWQLGLAAAMSVVFAQIGLLSEAIPKPRGTAAARIFARITLVRVIADRHAHR